MSRRKGQRKDVRRDTSLKNASKKGRFKERKYDSNAYKEMHPDEKPHTEQSSTNDDDWYDGIPGLLERAASKSFNMPAGIPFSLDVDNEKVTDAETVTPGVMTMSIVPGIGTSGGWNSAINTASVQYYAFVRHQNSGAANYNSPDLMIRTIAIAQVYAFINFLMRVFGQCRVAAAMNRYLPQTLLAAQNVNYGSIIDNLSDFLFGLNTLIYQAAQLACPANMKYFKRLAFLFSGYYAEGEDIRSQLYMYVPQGFLKYNETLNEQGGGLEYVDYWRSAPTNGYTYDQLLRYGRDLLNPLIASEDIGIMTGDILKAYGPQGVLKLQTVPIDYMVLPTTDLTVLEQFQNASWTNKGTDLVATISQKQSGRGPTIESEIGYTAFGDANTPGILEAVSRRKIMTTILTNPSYKDVAERTRLMSTYYEQDGQSPSKVVLTVEGGTEFAVDVRVWYTDPTSNNIANMNLNMLNIIPAAPSAADMIQLAKVHCHAEKFKFHPCLYYFTTNSGGGAWTFMDIAFDLDNYVTFRDDEIGRIDSAVMFNLFAVESIGMFK